MSKWNYVFGAVTIGLIVGGTIYAIKKSKDAEKLDETAISVDEAREILAREKGDAVEEVVHFQAPIAHNTAEPTEVKKVHKSYHQTPRQSLVAPISGSPYADADEEEDMDMDEGMEEIFEDEHKRGESTDMLMTVTPIEPLIDFMFVDEEGIRHKEDRILRYEKDSQEARHQFIKMELASWSYDHTVYRIMLQLFEIPLYPTNVGDDVLRTQIIDYKAQFFGITSKWVKEVSFADIILHYARAATFNCGHFDEYWVEYFLQFNDFTWEMTTQEIEMNTLRLAGHNYMNEERQTFGMFGLTRASMDQALLIASRNPDRAVTFEIEFQEFLKSCL